MRARQAGSVRPRGRSHELSDHAASSRRDAAENKRKIGESRGDAAVHVQTHGMVALFWHAHGQSWGDLAVSTCPHRSQDPSLGCNLAGLEIREREMFPYCRTLAFVFAAALGLGMLPISAKAVTLTNGSFESASVDPGVFETLSSGSTVITGWTVGGEIDYIGSYWQPDDGKRSLDMNGTTAGSISQMITGLTKGQAYLINFSLSGNPDSLVPPTRKLDVVVGLGAASYFFTIANTRENMGWIVQSLAFVADDTTALLKFSSAVTGAFGPALDNVSIAATPLPAALPLFVSLLSFFGLFSWLRRAREVTA